MGTPYEISLVLTENKGQLPVLVEFENGKINPARTEPLSCKMYRDSDDSSKKYVTIENGQTTYIGAPNTEKSPSHTYLAIRNRTTHKVQLVKVESVRATAAVGREIRDTVKSSDVISEDAVLDLSRQFGSRVSKRIHEQRRRFKTVAKSDGQLQDVVKDKVIKAEDLKVTSDDSIQKLLPPYDANADTAEEVYNIHDILTDEEMDSLKEGFEKKSVENEELFIKRCSPLFNTLLKSCMKNSKRMALLLYAEYLIRLCNKGKAASLDEICDCSEVIAEKICTDFLSKKKNLRVLSATDCDKVILRIIIIALHLADFKLEIMPLANSLKKTNTERVKLLMRVTGAKFGSRFSEVATLKTPFVPYKVDAKTFAKRPGYKK